MWLIAGSGYLERERSNTICYYPDVRPFVARQLASSFSFQIPGLMYQTHQHSTGLLRKQTIREGRDGLDHVEALLRLRGVDMPEVRSKRAPDAARRGEAQRIVLEALRGGPKTLREIAAVMAERRPQIPPDRVAHRASQALNKLRKAGVVVSEPRRVCRRLQLLSRLEPS